MAPDVADFILPVLHSGYVGEGPKTVEFEKALSEFIDNENIVTVSSGTAAITMALRLAGVGHGDRVITTPMTCLGTNEPILSLGAVPVWADILLDGTLDPDSVQKILDRSLAKAIIVMDWGGLPCRLDEFKKFDIPVIEDACQAIGSTYHGRQVGNDADFVCFSFQAIKHLTTIDGGALVINGKPDLVRRARLMRWFGLDRTQTVDMRCFQDPPLWGYKCQPNDVLASIGLANIRHLPRLIELCRNHASVYDKVLGRKESPDRKSCYWLYTVFVEDQQEFISYMKDNGVMASLVHDRNDTKAIFKGWQVLAGVDYFDAHHVCIPVGWWLTDEDVQKISQLIEGRTL